MFDISTLALKEDTFEMQFRHPATSELLFSDDEKTKKVSVNLYGTASKQYRNALRGMQDRQLKRNAKKEKPSSEIFKEEGLSLIVACIDGFNNFAVGGKVPTTEADFRELLGNPQFSWIKDQIDEALGDTSNFLPQ